MARLLLPRCRRLTRHAISVTLTLLLIIILTTPASAAGSFVPLPDFPVPNGHFYSEASGSGVTSGYAITDDDGVRLYSDFLSLGGVSQLGYPVSQRFILGGLVTQATQKDILQWQPSTGRVNSVGVIKRER